MFKKIIGALAGLSLALPVQAATWDEVKELADLVAGTGTTVEARVCQRPGIYGYYHFNASQDIDLLVICSNTVDMNDVDMVWEVLAHESTHVMQACNGNYVVKDSYVPRLARELQTYAPQSWATLQQYPIDKRRSEIEAFWMELREPEFVMDWVRDFCYEM